MQTFYPGQGVTLYTDFDVALDGPPHYEVRRNTDRALVQEGVAKQDEVNVTRWTAPIVFPDDATPGIYTVDWLTTSKQQGLKNTERFTLGTAKAEYIEVDRLVREGQPVADILLLDDGQTADAITVTVRDAAGTVLMTSTESMIAPGTTQGDPFYKVVFPQGLKTNASPFAAYLVQWDFTLDGVPETEYHFLYVASYPVLSLVNELRRMIDKAQLQHKNPALVYNDVDLVAFLNLGLQRINASPPTMTQYSLNALPETMFTYVLKAAAIEALDSRFLAEAEAAFNFSGQTVTLDVDRTGFIESARAHYQEALEDLKTVKKVLVMSTGGASGSPGVGTSAGVLVLSRSASLDTAGFWGNLNSSWTRGSRAIFYDQLLGQL